MEPITHFLTGACMSRAGLNRKTALATLTLTLAADPISTSSTASATGLRLPIIAASLTHFSEFLSTPP